MEERLNIIESFKHVNGKPQNGVDRRITYSKIMIFFGWLLILFIWGSILLSFMRDFLGLTLFRWEKMAMLVLYSSFAETMLFLPIYGLKVLQHQKIIEKNRGHSISESLNIEFKEIIENINKRHNKWLIGSLMVIILILSMWQMFSENQNPYWDFAKIPVLLFIGITAFNFYKTYNKLTKNIEKAEETL